MDDSRAATPMNRLRHLLAKSAALGCLGMTVAAAAPVAGVNPTDWSLTCTDTTIGCSGSGTLTTGAAGSATDSFVVTGASGEIDGYSITGLSAYAGSDNLLYDPGVADPGSVDFGGISFTTNGGPDFNIGGTTVSGQYVLNDASVNPSGDPNVPGSYNITFIATAIPEPATLGLLGLGLAGIGRAPRKRAR